MWLSIMGRRHAPTSTQAPCANQPNMMQSKVLKVHEQRRCPFCPTAKTHHHTGGTDRTVPSGLSNRPGGQTRWRTP
eukprot:10278080-Alexandrium_andersonii.AAC.1